MLGSAVYIQIVELILVVVAMYVSVLMVFLGAVLVVLGLSMLLFPPVVGGVPMTCDWLCCCVGREKQYTHQASIHWPLT